MSENIRWGILSCARIAETAVIPAIQKASNGTLQAIASNSADKLERFKTQFKPVSIYNSYDYLLNDPNIDAVYIPLPNALHKEYVFKAAAKKKHILCEKPLGLNSAEVEAMFDTCKENGVILQEAFAYRHNPVIYKLRDMIRDGAIGKLKHLESAFTFYLDNPTDIRLKKSLGGGSLYDVGSYPVNFFRFTTGKDPIKIVAQAEMHPTENIDLACYATLKYSDDCYATLYSAFNSQYRCDYKLTGTQGSIEVRRAYNTAGYIEIRYKREDGTEMLHIMSPDNYELQAVHFAWCILNKKTPIVSSEESIANAKTIDKIFKEIKK